MFDERDLPSYFTAVVGESDPKFRYNGAFILYENDAAALPADRLHPCGSWVILHMYKFAGLRGAVPRAGEWLRSLRRLHWMAAGFCLTFVATAGVVTPRFANATHDDSSMLS